MADNLWNSWPEVPPEHTKWVDQKGGYTNVEAYWLIGVLTEKFGPMGLGWGLRDEVGEFILDGRLFSFRAWFWYVAGDGGEGTFPIAVAVRCLTRKDGEERIDEDAPKKAITAAISKASSYLGLAKSVYLGEWTRGGHTRNAAAAPAGVARTSESSSHTPVSGDESPNKADFRRIKQRLDTEFGDGSLYDKQDGTNELTPASKLKLKVLREAFGETKYKALMAMPHEQFHQMARDNFLPALEKVCAEAAQQEVF